MLHTARSTLRLAPFAVSLLVLAAGAALFADGGNVTVDTEQSSCVVDKDTRLRKLDNVTHQLVLPGQGSDVKLTSMIQLFPLDPALFDAGPVRKARAQATISCVGPEGQKTVASIAKNFDRTGHLAISEKISFQEGCDFYFVDWDFLKRFKLPAGTSPVVRSGAETLAPTADNGCFRTDTLCLNDDRFRVEVGWRDFTGKSGPGIAFPRSDDSGTFFFFDADNTELLLKVLDGCATNGHYWVFYGATTDVEFRVTVTDTTTNQTRDYDNILGNPAPPILDTQAFATCP